MSRRVLPLSYQLFNGICKYPLPLILRLHELISKCNDPMYIKALGCIISSEKVMFHEEWSALCWEPELLKSITQHHLINLPCGPLISLLMQGHPLSFSLLLIREVDEENEMPQVMLYEIDQPENNTIVVGKIFQENSAKNYHHYIYPITFDPAVAQGCDYRLVIPKKTGLRSPRFMLQML